jgi:hypothetical protein
MNDLVHRLRHAAMEIRMHGTAFLNDVEHKALLQEAANAIAAAENAKTRAVTQTAPVHKLHRGNDPDTAREAAKSVSRRSGGQRMRVWAALNELGSATDFELADHIGILRSSAAKRRQELCEAGLVLDTGRRRQTDTGTMAIVWCPIYRSQND